MTINLYGNINGKSYHAPTINLFEQAKTQNPQPKMLKDTGYGENMPEVKVSISKDGLRALHGTGLAGSMDLADIQKRKEFMLNHQPVESFSNVFSNAMPSNYEKGENGEYVYVKRSAEEKAESILNAYKSLYDEIVSGYDEGTRIRFVEEETAEDGYRQISKEEELSILQNEFRDFVERRLSTESENLLEAAKSYGNESNVSKEGNSVIMKLSPVNHLAVFHDFQTQLSEMHGESVSDSFDNYVNKMATVYNRMRDSIVEKYADSKEEQMYYVADDGNVHELTKEKELEMLDKAYEKQSKLIATSSEIWADLANFQPRIKEQAYQAFMSATSMENREILLHGSESESPIKLNLNIAVSDREQLNNIWDFYLKQKRN